MDQETEWQGVVNEGPSLLAVLPRVSPLPVRAGEGTWIYRTGAWLFVQRGMCAVLLLGLMGFGLLGAFLGY